MVRTVDPAVDPRVTIGIADPCEVDPIWSTIQQPKGGAAVARKKKGIFVFGIVGPRWATDNRPDPYIF